MKDLTGNTITEKNKQSTTPINILKIEFGGAIGTKYYADRNITVGSVIAIGKVISWGGFSKEKKDTEGTISSFSIEFSDTDRIIWDYGNTIEIQEKSATLFQHFEGNLEADLEEIYIGIIRAIIWEESEARVTLEIVEKTSFWDIELGQVADKENFPDIATSQKNTSLPVVIGKVEKVQSVLIETGKETRLSIPLISYLFQKAQFDPNSIDTVVDEGKEFAQNIPLDLWVGTEYVKGSFSGRKLTITERERTVISSTTTAVSTKMNNLVCDLLVPVGSHWLGLFFLIDIPHDLQIWINSPTTMKRLCSLYKSPDEYFFTQSNGWFPNYLITLNCTFLVYGPAVAREKGTQVLEYRTSYTWCFNYGNVSLIEHVVVKGDLTEREVDVPGQRPIAGIETWLEIQKDLYSLNYNDNSYTVKPLSTLTMGFLPAWNPTSNYKDNVLHADVTGLLGEVGDSPSGNVYNPAALIKKICLTYMGMTSADIDTTSYNQACTDVDWLHISFSSNSLHRGLDFIYDIAFQCRLSLFWEQGKLHFKYLQDSLGISIATIEDTDRKMDSYIEEEESSEEVITRVIVKWKEGEKEKQKELINTNAELTFQKKIKTLDFWAHNKEAYAVGIAYFYLYRWSSVYKRVKFSTFLSSLEVERGDWVTLNFTDFQVVQKVEVLRIGHKPGSGTNESIDLIEIEGRIPLKTGCSGNCELYTELFCDASCEFECQTTEELDCSYACEENTQEACDLVCVTFCQVKAVTCQHQCQLDCQSNCRLDCQEGCELEEQECSLDCTTGCTTGCTADCESSCQMQCTETCELNCQGTSCMTSCESAGCEAECELVCEELCMWGCQQSYEYSDPGCLYACEFSCQSPCTVGCEHMCQITCTSVCECGCQKQCTLVCERSCKVYCTSESIQLGCDLTCQEGSCTLMWE